VQVAGQVGLVGLVGLAGQVGKVELLIFEFNLNYSD